VRKRVKHHEGCKIVKYETPSGKTSIVSDEACRVWYDLNLTFRCLRFYYVAPLPVLDPIYLHLDLIGSKSKILSSYLVISCIVTIHTLPVNVKTICTSFRNRKKSEPLTSFSFHFQGEYKFIWDFLTMYTSCV